MKRFKEYLLEDHLSNLQDKLRNAETPEEIERITKEIAKMLPKENKKYK